MFTIFNLFKSRRFWNKLDWKDWNNFEGITREM